MNEKDSNGIMVQAVKESRLDSLTACTIATFIEVGQDTAKLANVILIVAGFGEKCNLVREGNMFVKDKAKISSRVGDVK